MGFVKNAAGKILGKANLTSAQKKTAAKVVTPKKVEVVKPEPVQAAPVVEASKPIQSQEISDGEPV